MLCLAFSSGHARGRRCLPRPETHSETGMLKASSGSSGLTARHLFRIRAQSAGMLKPTVLLQLIRCSVATESHFSFPAANDPSNWKHCALFAGQSASCGLCGADILVREMLVLLRICEYAPLAFADKNVRATRADHLPCDGSALVALSTSTCIFCDGSTPGG